MVFATTTPRAQVVPLDHSPRTCHDTMVRYGSGFGPEEPKFGSGATQKAATTTTRRMRTALRLRSSSTSSLSISSLESAGGGGTKPTTTNNNTNNGNSNGIHQTTTRRRRLGRNWPRWRSSRNSQEPLEEEEWSEGDDDTIRQGRLSQSSRSLSVPVLVGTTRVVPASNGRTSTTNQSIATTQPSLPRKDSAEDRGVFFFPTTIAVPFASPSPTVSSPTTCSLRQQGIRRAVSLSSVVDSSFSIQAAADSPTRTTSRDSRTPKNRPRLCSVSSQMSAQSLVGFPENEEQDERGGGGGDSSYSMVDTDTGSNDTTQHGTSVIGVVRDTQRIPPSASSGIEDRNDHNEEEDSLLQPQEEPWNVQEPLTAAREQRRPTHTPKRSSSTNNKTLLHRFVCQTASQRWRTYSSSSTSSTTHN